MTSRMPLTPRQSTPGINSSASGVSRLATSPISSTRLAMASTAISSSAQLAPTRAVYPSTASMQSMIRLRISLSRGVIQHHSIAVDSLGERESAYWCNQEIDVPTEELVGVRVQADTLGQAEMAPRCEFNE